MKCYKDIDEQIEAVASAAAMGTFDGMHLGHRAVINQMVSRAEILSLSPTVITFDDVPKRQTQKDVSLIMSLDEKLALLERWGIAHCVVLPFNPLIRTLTARQFLDKALSNQKIRSLSVGYDFHFGKNAAGDVDFLARHQSLGYELNVVPAVQYQNKPISSTRIRRALNRGDIFSANAMLGRHHFVRGKVKVGKQIGTKIGFATANMTIDKHMTAIKPGVYISATKVGDDIYRSVSNVGFNPTFNQKDFNIETYLLNFNAVLYERVIEVLFYKRLRDELRFETTAALAERIARDVALTEAYFKDNPLR